MVVKLRSTPFGSETRTRILVTLQMLKSSYPRELARLLDVPLMAVQRALLSLEKDALVAGRSVGRTRQFVLNPVYFARKELAALLARLADADPELQARAAELRRRPRRTGKPL